MRRYKQFAPILVSAFEVSKWHHPKHNHNHYELIYIKQGSGIHVINSQPVSYKSGSVFLLGPEETHFFEIGQKTQFVYLKFTDLYLYKDEAIFNSGIRHLEYLLKSRETHSSNFTLDVNDQQIVNQLFEVILSMQEDLLKNEQLIWMQALAVMHVLQRNMPEIKSHEHRTRDMQAVFCYIHKHIYNPDKLKGNVMAANFNLTKAYMGQYFKKNSGTTIRDYIGQYRSNLIRQRWNSGRFSLKQIAAEFGLTDESHVSKILKNNPTVD